jgi:hypothetical protein
MNCNAKSTCKRYHGNNYGTARTVSPVLTNAKSLLFDGSNEYATLTTSLDYNYTDGFSVSAWIKTSAALTVNRVIVSNLGSNGRGLEIAIETTGRLYVQLINTYPTNYTKIQSNATSGFNDGAWHNVAVTKASGSGGAAAFKLYKDGALIGSGTVASSLDTNSLSNTGGGTGSPMLIGRRPSDASLIYSGSMDEVSFWSKELTADEVLGLRNGTAPSNLLAHAALGNLVSWYRMGDDVLDSNTVLRDARGSNHGTLNNMESTDLQSDVPT